MKVVRFALEGVISDTRGGRASIDQEGNDALLNERYEIVNCKRAMSIVSLREVACTYLVHWDSLG